jgi:catalase
VSGDDLGVTLVDAINALVGVHPGFRAAHAKGTCCKGSFTATPDAARLSRSAHFQGDPVPVTLRFSNGSGNPNSPDSEHDGRGMAVKFHLPDGSSTDIVAITLSVFFVRTAKDFLEFTTARVPDPETGAPDMDKVGAFLAAHPEAHQAVGQAIGTPPPASYARCRFHSLHAYRFLDASGGERFIRYRWDPEAGEASLTDDEAQARPSDYLTSELEERFAGGPVVFTLFAQVAAEGDDTTDPTQAWPDDREVVELGRLELTEFTGTGCDAMIFDPTNVTDGIECSADEILAARSAAYSVSYARRTKA